MCIARAKAPTARGPSRKCVKGSMLMNVDDDEVSPASEPFDVQPVAYVLGL